MFSVARQGVKFGKVAEYHSVVAELNNSAIYQSYCRRSGCMKDFAPMEISIVQHISDDIIVCGSVQYVVQGDRQFFEGSSGMGGMEIGGSGAVICHGVVAESRVEGMEFCIELLFSGGVASRDRNRSRQRLPRPFFCSIRKR